MDALHLPRSELTEKAHEVLQQELNLERYFLMILTPNPKGEDYENVTVVTSLDKDEAMDAMAATYEALNMYFEGLCE